ncbi:MAG: AAA family ATPase [Bacilli bacterium]|nr:AAA family ATPase [Bacilli bacterium]
MVYLESFKLLDELDEHNSLINEMQIYNGNYYPYGLFSYKEFRTIDFDDITIFYGGNGSGKTTLLNIVSEKINANRNNKSYKGMLFKKYADSCECKFERKYLCDEIKLISSDDVFDYLLDVRAINTGVNRRKADLAHGYLEDAYGSEETSRFQEYNNLKRKVETKRMSKSQFIRHNLVNNNIQEQSNGETALNFWQTEIKENALYILDEPENSLSAENQLKLKQFIEESVRFYKCQFIISTHSPFLLSLYGAKIYDLDENPVKVKKWNELKNVKVYYDFFKDNKDVFEIRRNNEI